MDRIPGVWRNSESIPVRSFTCGYCGREVASDRGWYTTDAPRQMAYAHLCPNCNRATLFYYGQWPGVKPGSPISHLPKQVEQLLEESRDALAAGAPTVAVLGFRKLLMHVAVEKGATAGDSFQSYVTFLDVHHHVPVGAKEWVDHIRTRGNEANHEISMMTAADANELYVFVDMLLRLTYDFPNRLPKKP